MIKVKSAITACVDYPINETRLIFLATCNLRREKFYLMIIFSPYPNVIMGGSPRFHLVYFKVVVFALY